MFILISMRVYNGREREFMEIGVAYCWACLYICVSDIDRGGKPKRKSRGYPNTRFRRGPESVLCIFDCVNACMRKAAYRAAKVLSDLCDCFWGYRFMRY